MIIYTSSPSNSNRSSLALSSSDSPIWFIDKPLSRSSEFRAKRLFTTVQPITSCFHHSSESCRMFTRPRGSRVSCFMRAKPIIHVRLSHHVSMHISNDCDFGAALSKPEQNFHRIFRVWTESGSSGEKDLHHVVGICARTKCCVVRAFNCRH